jgi:hypothetical protein
VVLVLWLLFQMVMMMGVAGLTANSPMAHAAGSADHQGDQIGLKKKRNFILFILPANLHTIIDDRLESLEVKFSVTELGASPSECGVPEGFLALDCFRFSARWETALDGLLPDASDERVSERGAVSERFRNFPLGGEYCGCWEAEADAVLPRFRRSNGDPPAPFCWRNDDRALEKPGLGSFSSSSSLKSPGGASTLVSSRLSSSSSSSPS